jgi:hypothetical protein
MGRVKLLPLGLVERDVIVKQVVCESPATLVETKQVQLDLAFSTCDSQHHPLSYIFQPIFPVLCPLVLTISLPQHLQTQRLRIQHNTCIYYIQNTSGSHSL